MRKWETVDVTVADHVAVLTLNRPDKLNAFNRQMRLDLLAAIKAVNENDEVRVCILTGAGRSFCSGADLADKPPVEQTVEQRLELEYKPALMAIAEAPKPYIAAVKGAAAGIGSAFALVCDMVVMGQSAYLYQAFSAIGLIPDGGLTWQLARQLGHRRAYEMIALGEKIDARLCVDLGLANRVSDDEAELAEAKALAQALMARAPLSLRYAKQALREAIDLNFAQAVSNEAKLQMIASRSDDHTEGKKAFLEKRSPVWKGR